MNEFLLLILALSLLSFLWALSEYLAVRRLWREEKAGGLKKRVAAAEIGSGAEKESCVEIEAASKMEAGVEAESYGGYAARLEDDVENLRYEVLFLKEKLLEFSSFKEERKKNLTELNRIGNKVNSALSKARAAANAA